MFTWKNAYETGNAVIDSQHQQLFDLGSQVGRLLVSRQDDGLHEELKGLLKGLQDYSVYHFDFEEGMLEAVGYPYLEQHQKEHERFVEELNKLAGLDLGTFQSKVAVDMLGFLSNWIERHILGSDFKYNEYV